MERPGFDPKAPAIDYGVLTPGPVIHWQRNSDLSEPSPRQVDPGLELEILEARDGALLARGGGSVGWLPRARVGPRQGSSGRGQVIVQWSERQWLDFAGAQSVQRELPPLPAPLRWQDDQVPDPSRVAGYLRECAASATSCERYRRVRSLPVESLQFASLGWVDFPTDEDAYFWTIVPSSPSADRQLARARQIALRRHVASLEIRSADAVIAGFVAGQQLDVSSTGGPGSERWRAVRDSLLAQAARKTYIDRERSISTRHVKVTEYVRAAVAHSSLEGSKSLFDWALSGLAETAASCECGCESSGRVDNGWVQGGAAGMIATGRDARWLLLLYRVLLVAAVIAVVPILVGWASPLLLVAILLGRIPIRLLWLLWSGSVAVNARVLGSTDAPSRVSMVVWWWVPLANWVMPYRKMRRLMTSLAWFGEQGPERPLLRWWWLGVVGVYPAAAFVNFSFYGWSLQVLVLLFVGLEAVYASQVIRQTERRQAIWVGRKLRGDPDPRLLGTSTATLPLRPPPSLPFVKHAESDAATRAAPMGTHGDRWGFDFTSHLPPPEPEIKVPSTSPLPPRPAEEGSAAAKTTRYCGACGALRERPDDQFCRSCGRPI